MQFLLLLLFEQAEKQVKDFFSPSTKIRVSSKPTPGNAAMCWTSRVLIFSISFFTAESCPVWCLTLAKSDSFRISAVFSRIFMENPSFGESSISPSMISITANLSFTDISHLFSRIFTFFSLLDKYLKISTGHSAIFLL